MNSMSYEPTNWKSGDVVTSAKLNKLEQGVAEAGGSGGGFLKVGFDTETLTLDKTWKQIFDALSAGYFVNVFTEQTESEQARQSQVYECLYGDDYIVHAYTLSGGNILFATFAVQSENGYPVFVKD